MYAAAPRLDRRMLDVIIRLDDSTVPIAEVYRRTRRHAANLGLPRPSYECVRQLIHDSRRERTRRRANRETLIRVALYLDGPEALDRLELAPHIHL